MALYEYVFPDTHRPDRIRTFCGLLGIEPDFFRRIRDVWMESVDGELIIAVYTRLGGANRADYAATISALRAHQLYLSDRDDKYDSTYATFRFRVPDSITPESRKGLLLTAHSGEVDTDERWKNAIARVERGELTPDEIKLAERLFGAGLDDEDGSDGVRIIRV